MSSTNGLFLARVSEECHWTQDSYLAQVTGHATGELEQVLRSPALGKSSIQDNGSGSIASMEFE